MVECEFSIASANVSPSVVLIDTWWNVNFTPKDGLRSCPLF